MIAALRARWRGEVVPARLLWPEMLLWGTGVNLLASFVGLMWLARGGPGLGALALHLAPLPLSAWWLACLWRHAAARPVQRGLGAAWLGLMLVV